MTLTLAIIACFVDAGLTTFSILMPSKYDSSSMRPSARAVLTLCSIFFTSLYRFFFEFETLVGFSCDEEAMGDKEEAGEPSADEEEVTASEGNWGSITS